MPQLSLALPRDDNIEPTEGSMRWLAILGAGQTAQTTGGSSKDQRRDKEILEVTRHSITCSPFLFPWTLSNENN